MINPTVEYDKTTDSIYVWLKKPNDFSVEELVAKLATRSILFNKDIILDFATDGSLVGIDIQKVSEVVGE